jgi:PAS domain S-box-containing protein
MYEIVILNTKNEESLKLKNKLEDICSNVSIYNPEQKTDYKIQTAENYTIYICKLELSDSDTRENSIEIASSKSSPIIFIVSEVDDAFLNRISKSDTIWYIKEPYTQSELNYLIEKVSGGQHAIMESFSMFSENVHDFAFTMAANGNLIYVSPSVEKVTGFTQKETLEKGLKELVPEETFNFIGGMMGAFFAKLKKGETAKASIFEIEILCKDNSTLWMELSINPVFDSERNFRYFSGVMHNITDRKKAEERFDAAVKSSSDLIYEWNMQTDELEWFGDIEKTLGYEYGEINRSIDGWSEIVHPDDLPVVTDIIDNYRKEGDDFEAEYRVLTKDGNVRYWKEHGTPVFDKITKEFVKTIGVCSDITDETETKKELEEKDELFRLIAENANDVIWVLNENGELLYISPSIRKLRGYDPEEVQATPIEKRIINESGVRAMETWNDFFRKFKNGMLPDTSQILEVEQTCKDGSTVWTEMHVNPILDDKGNFRYFLGITRDITERRKNEQNLRKQKNMLDNIFEHAPVPMMLLNEEAIVENINYACTDMLQRKKKNMLGLKAGEVFNCINSVKGDGCGTNRECVKCIFRNSAIETFLTKKNILKREGKTTILTPDGKAIGLNVLVSTAYIELSEAPKIVVSVEDITSRKKVEETIIKSKLEAEEANRTKSEFLATMSHELRTPLNAIIGYSQMLQDSNFGSLNPKQDKFTGHIYTSGKHLLELINDILDLSKVEAGKMDLHLETFDVKNVLNTISIIIKPLAENKKIEVDFLIDQDISIYADKIRYKQILYNLLSNAVKFTPRDGHVTVKISNNGNVLTTSVIDDGIGISREEQKKLFDPFYQTDSSTARKYQGTGLGLSIVKKMVELHEGTISVKSEPGKGSTFTFILPIKEE